jgi:glycosyltransferase involved in cell wall biosynthesis
LLNIKIITYGNFPFGGAAANFIRNLAIGLAENDTEVEVLLPHGHFYGTNVELNTSSVNNIKNVKYRFCCFKRHPTSLIGKLLDNICGPIVMFVYLLFEGFRKKYKYILKYDVTFSSQMLQLILSKILRIKLVNIIPEYYEKPETGIKRLFKWYNFYFGIEILLKFADAYIVLSYFLEDEIKKKNKDAKVLVQPNIIDPAPFINNEQIQSHQNILIGYTGTPTQKDGIIDLLGSFKIVHDKISDVKLLVIGDITNGQTVILELKNHCFNLGIDQWVEFTGLVPFSQIPELLQKCDILVLARPRGIFAEAGFPTKLGEYFATKKPVVATEVGDLGFYFKSGYHLLLARPGDIVDIAEKIFYLIEKPELRTEIGGNGFDWMKKNLEYELVSQKIISFLNTV